MESDLFEWSAPNPWASAPLCDAALLGLMPLVANRESSDDLARAHSASGEECMNEDSLVAKLRAADSLLQNRRRKKFADAMRQIRSQRPRIYHSSYSELMKLEEDVKAWAAEKIKCDGDVNTNAPLSISQVQVLNLLFSNETAASVLQRLVEAHAVATRIAELGLDRGSH